MKKKAIYIIIVSIIIFIVDRYKWMPERAQQLWQWEKGLSLGDPISYNQDFEISGFKILFKNNKSKEDYPVVYKNRKSDFYLLGCYFGKLYIYDIKRNKTIIYYDR